MNRHDTFVCDRCRRRFELAVLYLREKERLCPRCYAKQYVDSSTGPIEHPIDYIAERIPSPIIPF